eukprot:scaffold3237_cov524-Prasinococcus_capsulatus_cf.AAC.1
MARKPERYEVLIFDLQLAASHRLRVKQLEWDSVVDAGVRENVVYEHGVISRPHPIFEGSAASI